MHLPIEHNLPSSFGAIPKTIGRASEARRLADYITRYVPDTRKQKAIEPFLKYFALWEKAEREGRASTSHEHVVQHHYVGAYMATAGVAPSDPIAPVVSASVPTSMPRWAQLPPRVSATGALRVLRIVLTPPEELSKAILAIGLTTIIRARITPDDQTIEMARLLVLLPQLVGAEHDKNVAVARRLTAEIFSIYPAAFRDAHSYLSSPWYEKVLKAEDDAVARGLEGNIARLNAHYRDVSEEIPIPINAAKKNAAPNKKTSETVQLPDAAPLRLTGGTVVHVPVKDIIIDPKRRARVDQLHVDALAESIKSTGLQNPISVTTSGELTAGAHRLLAHEKLGLETILAHVRDLDGQRQRLAEIDENLVRRLLPALELAELTRERQQLYESLYPETRQHVRGGRAKASRGATAFIAVAEAFASDTAKKSGISERTVRQYAQVAKIPAAVRDAVRDTPVAQSINELVALAHVPNAQQVHVARLIADGKVKKIAEARALLDAVNAPNKSYAVTQAPVIRKQWSAITRLHGELQKTAAEWLERDAVGLKDNISFNTALAATIGKAVEAAPAAARALPIRSPKKARSPRRPRSKAS